MLSVLSAVLLSAILSFASVAAADLEEGPGGTGPPRLFWVNEKEEMTEERKAIRASKSKPPPSPVSSRSGFAAELSLFDC